MRPLQVQWKRVKTHKNVVKQFKSHCNSVKPDETSFNKKKRKKEKKRKEKKRKEKEEKKKKKRKKLVPATWPEVEVLISVWGRLVCSRRRGVDARDARCDARDARARFSLLRRHPRRFFPKVSSVQRWPTTAAQTQWRCQGCSVRCQGCSVRFSRNLVIAPNGAEPLWTFFF